MAGVNSVAPALALPAKPSMAAVETPVKAPSSSTDSAPIHGPPRVRCWCPEPSGYSNDAERDVRFVPMKP